MSINLVCLSGRLTTAPELRTTASGIEVCSVQIAVDRGYGEKKETDFISLQFWRGTAETLCKYTKKGDKITVSGYLTTRKYEDKDGNNRTVYEVVVNSLDLPPKQKEQEFPQKTETPPQTQKSDDDGFPF